MTKIISLNITLFILIFGTLYFSQKVTTPENINSSVDRTIYYSYKLENRSNKASKNVDFWTFIPIKLTSTQQLTKLTVSHPYELIKDKYGNQVIHIIFPVIAPYATEFINIQADLLMSKVPRHVELKNRGVFLIDEPFIEVNNPEIQKVASTLTGNDISGIEGIYNWTSNYVQGISYIKEDRGALYALRNKVGDCTEFAYLFTAICRVKGIPSRVLGGYVLPENGTLAPEAYHNWSEFYVDGAWHVVDPQEKIFMQDYSKFIAMSVVSTKAENPMGRFHRFRVRGDNIYATMQ